MAPYKLIVLETTLKPRHGSEPHPSYFSHWVSELGTGQFLNPIELQFLTRPDPPKPLPDPTQFVIDKNHDKFYMRTVLQTRKT